jgi:hypothetical protein
MFVPSITSIVYKPAFIGIAVAQVFCAELFCQAKELIPS